MHSDFNIFILKMETSEYILAKGDGCIDVHNSITYFIYSCNFWFNVNFV